MLIGLSGGDPTFRVALGVELFAKELPAFQIPSYWSGSIPTYRTVEKIDA